mgnify:FL=1
MRKFTKSLFVVLMVMVLLLSFMFAIQAKKATVNRFNVVFVMDTSGSMDYSDNEENRFEATDLFLAMLANQGNNVGLVTFSDSIKSNNVVAVDSIENKMAISKNIRERKSAGDTDIGGALLKATDMLKSMKSDLPSIIILLSDGNTDLKTEDMMATSKANKESALEVARDNHIKIYTVILNSDGVADKKELEQIATATNATFAEVTSSKDLSNVFERFYSEIYGTESNKLVDKKIPSDGVVKETFEVSRVGVEEVNIAVFGDANEYEFISPSGKIITKDDLSDNVFSADTFDLIKLTEPERGIWTVIVKGKSGSELKVVKSYNSNFNLKTTSSGMDKPEVNKQITLNVKMYEGDSAINDIVDYQEYKAVLSIKTYDGKLLKEISPTVLDDGSYSFNYTPDKIGTYYLQATVSDGTVSASTESMTLDIGNTAPVAEKNPIEKHFYIWPFFHNDCIVDLKEIAKDNEDSTLSYKIISSSWDPKDYSFSGNTIKIESFKDLSKGSFEIQAIDSQGAFCTVNVKITSTNVGIVALITILAGGLLALAIIGIITYRQFLAPFMGDIEVYNLSTRQISKQSKNRGRLKFGAFPIGNTGINPKSYFQATAKDYVYFVTKKPLYSDQLFKASKKIKIKNSETITLYTDQEHTNGIEVTFISFNNNSGLY